MVVDLTAGIPASSGNESKESTSQHLNDLRRALPTEIARVATKITQLEKELTQLEECKLDLTENLFQGLDNDDAGMGEGLEGKGTDLRNLAVWRRLNEFKTDIDGERKKIEMEALRVQSHISKLKESKQWLTDMSIKVNQLAESSTNQYESNRLIKEFKGYLRKKIGLE